MSQADYEVKHEVCPRCGTRDFEEWTIGTISLVDGNSGRSPNRRACQLCKCRWWAPEIIEPGGEQTIALADPRDAEAFAIGTRWRKIDGEPWQQLDDGAPAGMPTATGPTLTVVAIDREKGTVTLR